MFDVLVVGGGPAGFRTAWLVAKKGYEVLVVEEHEKIGEPVSCTGLVSKKIGKIPKDIILNKIKTARFFCEGEYFDVNYKKGMMVIDRKGYDVFLYEKAKEEGVRIKKGTRFISFRDGVVKTSKGSFESKILVGADGPNSSVAKNVGIDLMETISVAVQTTVKGSFEKRTVELHFDPSIKRGFFWVVPENGGKARVGLMCERNPRRIFHRFLEKRFGKNVRTSKIVSDVIRYGLMERTVSDRVLLVGDAASQVKPFSCGGLVYGKICSEIAARAIVKALREEKFSREFLKENYEDVWKEKLFIPIILGNSLKIFFDFISSYPFLFQLFGKMKIGELAGKLDPDFFI